MKIAPLIAAAFAWIAMNTQTDAFANPIVPEVSLEIQPAVELVFPSTRGYRYKLFHSTDLNLWEEIPGEHDGTGYVMSIFRRAKPNVRGTCGTEIGVLAVTPLPAGSGDGASRRRVLRLHQGISIR